MTPRPKHQKEPTLAELAEGCHLALDNAERLLATAEPLTESDPATASYLVAMACEEIGKAGILAARWRVFDGEGVYPEGLLEEVLAMPEVRESVRVDWNDLYAKEFCQHTDKTAAFYQMYGSALGEYEQVVEVDENTIQVIDPIGRLKDKDDHAVKWLRGLIEKSLYLDWDGQNGGWLTPSGMVNIAEFRTAVMGLMPKFREGMPKQ